jgi:hypothetical protein
VLEVVTVVAGLQDMAMMGQAVEQRRGQFGITEHAGPFGKIQVRGDDDTGFFIQFAGQVKE